MSNNENKENKLHARVRTIREQHKLKGKPDLPEVDVLIRIQRWMRDPAEPPIDKKFTQLCAQLFVKDKDGDGFSAKPHVDEIVDNYLTSDEQDELLRIINENILDNRVEPMYRQFFMDALPGASTSDAGLAGKINLIEAAGLVLGRECGSLSEAVAAVYDESIDEFIRNIGQKQGLAQGANLAIRGLMEALERPIVMITSGGIVNFGENKEGLNQDDPIFILRQGNKYKVLDVAPGRSASEVLDELFPGRNQPEPDVDASSSPGAK